MVVREEKDPEDVGGGAGGAGEGAEKLGGRGERAVQVVPVREKTSPEGVGGGTGGYANSKAGGKLRGRGERRCR